MINFELTQIRNVWMNDQRKESSFLHSKDLTDFQTKDGQLCHPHKFKQKKKKETKIQTRNCFSTSDEKIKANSEVFVKLVKVS
jgi:hypothetical protein